MATTGRLGTAASQPKNLQLGTAGTVSFSRQTSATAALLATTSRQVAASVSLSGVAHPFTGLLGTSLSQPANILPGAQQTLPSLQRSSAASAALLATLSRQAAAAAALSGTFARQSAVSAVFSGIALGLLRQTQATAALGVSSAVLRVQYLTSWGSALSYTAADPSGHRIDNLDGATLIYVKNGGGTALTLTLHATLLKDGNRVVDKQVIVLASGGELLIGRLVPFIYNTADGQVAVDYSATAGVLVAAVHA